MNFVRSKPIIHHAAPTVAPRARWPDYNPKGFAPCRRPPRPWGKERDRIDFLGTAVVAAAAATAAVAAGTAPVEYIIILIIIIVGPPDRRPAHFCQTVHLESLLFSESAFLHHKVMARNPGLLWFSHFSYALQGRI